MPFEHRIIQDDEDEFLLECDNVEALLGLDILADQLREDAAHLASRYPAEMSERSDVHQQPADGRGHTFDAAQSAMHQHRERCSSRIHELLQAQKRTARAGWLKRLASGAAVAAVAVVCTAIVWRIQVAEPVSHDLRGSSPGVSSTPQQGGQARVVDHSNRERFRPGLPGNDPFFVSSPAITRPSVHPTPVVFEMPAVFRSASEPEMEALLDLYDSETAGPVTIGF